MANGFWAVLFGVYAAATAVQLVVWWALFARLAFRKVDFPLDCETDTARLPPLSVLICVRNEAVNLAANLPAVLSQKYPEFEVLVIDDDSTDDTGLVLQALQKKYPHLHVLHTGPKTTPGKKQALARGIAVARHEHLVFADADCWPASPQWLRRMADCFLKKQEVEIVLGYGPCLPEPGLLNNWIRFETVHTATQYFSFALAGQPYMGVGRNLAWRRHLFGQVGGFSAHATLSSGDDDLFVNAAANNKNTAICLAPEAFVFSEGKKTWRNWWRQKIRHLRAGTRYRLHHRLLLGLLALTHFLHYFLLIVLLPTNFGIISVAFYAVRMASALPIHRKILCRLREAHLLIWFPLLDAFLAIYYAVLVPRALIYSDDLISWK
jgi:glycosyltransferase involved in cell wall biosynthesis